MIRLVIAASIISALAGAGIMLVRTYNAAVQRAAQLESDVSTLRQANADGERENLKLREDRARLDKLLAQREGVRQGAAAERRQLDAKLSDLFAKNQQVREWGDQIVPPALLDSLRLKPASRLDDGDGARKAASGMAGRDSGP